MSRLAITVDPVVVIPDILSNNESLKDISRFEKKKGKLPNRAIPTQEAVVNINASRKFNLFSLYRFDKINNTPTNMVMKDDVKKFPLFSPI